MSKEVLEAANALIVQRLIQIYLPADQEATVWTVEDVCITRQRMWSRYGVPADATSFRYILENPGEGWSVTARSVWRNSRLMEPVATHTRIERYRVDNADLIADENAARIAFNNWGKSVPL